MRAGRGRGRGGAVRATVTRGGHNLTNTGNGTITIILTLSFISLTLLGESDECGEMQTARGREGEVELLELQLQEEDII